MNHHQETDPALVAALRCFQVGDARPWVISLADTRELARVHGCSPRDVELAALDAKIIPSRYLRNLGTVGLEGQRRLLQSTVAVLGAGGLGGWVIEGLARMGVGHLIVIDGDSFEENNLNRQLGCTEDTLGLPKAEVLARRVAEINGTVTVTPHVCWFDAQNGPALLSGAQVIVDALDTLSARYTLQQVAAQLGLPLVHGAIAGYMGQVMTILPGDPGLQVLYGAMEKAPDRGVETELGNPSATPMMVSAWQVQEVVKLLLNQGTLLRHRILIMDAEYGEFREVDLAS